MINNHIKISEIKKGIYLCLENSVELLIDAELLLKNKSYARSYSFIQFAVEESGKSMMLYDLYVSLQRDERMEFDFKKFRKNFRDHKWKTYETNVVELMMYGSKNNMTDFKKFALENFAEIQKSKNGYYDKMKNDSLYVSIENDEFLKPNQIFNEEITTEYLEKSKLKINYIKDWTQKWLKMDEFLGVDKEAIINELKKK